MAGVTQGAYAFAGSLCDRFDAIEGRIEALELGKEQNDILEMLREFAPDMVAPDFRRKFTQADLDAAVKAERERCVGIIRENGRGLPHMAHVTTTVNKIEAGD